MVDESYDCLVGTGNLERFGNLLDESWSLKMSLDDGVANRAILDFYEQGRAAGAFGGKLLGAGGGGFLLFFVAPERRRQVRERLAQLEESTIAINAPGSHILHA